MRKDLGGGVKARAAIATTAAAAATGEELCSFNYNRDIKDVAIVPARNSNYNNATERLIALEGLNNAKSACINATYTAFYAAKNSALSALTTAKGAPTTGPDARYTICIGTRVSDWSWTR